MATTLGRGPKTIKGCEGISQRPIVDIDKDPRESITTIAVLFAVAAGYRWGCPKPYLDLVEEMPDKRIERRVYWIFDSESSVEIAGEKVIFGEFWDRIHSGWTNLSRQVFVQLSSAISVLTKLPPDERSTRLRYWADFASLAEPAKAIFSEAATIYDQFLEDRMPRFLLVQQARGKDTVRCYIPFTATPEERAAELARAGLA